jgi:hypothetical protein
VSPAAASGSKESDSGPVNAINMIPVSQRLRDCGAQLAERRRVHALRAAHGRAGEHGASLNAEPRLARTRSPKRGWLLWAAPPLVLLPLTIAPLPATESRSPMDDHRDSCPGRSRPRPSSPHRACCRRSDFESRRIGSLCTETIRAERTIRTSALWRGLEFVGRHYQNLSMTWHRYG